MSSSDPVAEPLRLPRRPVLRLGLVAALFALAGPPLGAMLALAYLSLFATVGSGVPFGEAFSTFLGAALPLDPAALYLAPYWGVVPALAGGVVTGWYEGWRGPVTAFSAALLGLGVGAAFYMVGAFLGWAGAAYGASFSIAVCVPVAMLLAAFARLLGRGDPVAGPDR